MTVASPFGDVITAQDIIATMQSLKGWEDRYRQVIQWGKKLPEFKEEDKLADILVSGCESQVWLFSEKKGDTWYFHADSDARIVRGLIAIALAAFNKKTSLEIEHFDIESYFNQIGLLEHLSSSRGNGLKAIVEEIQKVVSVG
ncbi:SufE family protein [Vibrio sp.]|nr:SufE family protein [Vibrio sp.]